MKIGTWRFFVWMSYMFGCFWFLVSGKLKLSKYVLMLIDGDEVIELIKQR